MLRNVKIQCQFLFFTARFYSFKSSNGGLGMINSRTASRMTFIKKKRFFKGVKRKVRLPLFFKGWGARQLQPATLFKSIIRQYRKRIARCRLIKYKCGKFGGRRIRLALFFKQFSRFNKRVC